MNRSACLALATACAFLAAASCREDGTPSSPGTTGTAAISVAPSFDRAGVTFESADIPINRIRLTARRSADGTLIETETTTVDPDAAEWQLSFSIALPSGPDVTVVVTIELTNSTAGVETVAWSGTTGPFVLAAGPSGAPMHVPVFPGPLANLGITAVAITPDGGTVDEGATLALSAATAGGTGGSIVYWTSLEPATATVTEAGLVTGVVPGTARIVAAAGPESDTVSVIVRQRVASIVVSPPAATLQSIGAVQPFSARALDPRGAEISGVTIEFSTAPASVAVHDGNGLVRAVGNGVATVSGSARGVTGTATLTVAQAPASVTVTPLVALIPAIGGAAQLTATVRDANDNAITGATVTWESSATGIADVNAEGVVFGVSPGSAVITARATPAISGAATVFVGSQTLFGEGFEGAFNWSVASFATRTTGAGILNRAHPLYVTSAGGAALPAAVEGTSYLWFGDPAEGNYLGTQSPSDTAGSGGTGIAPQTASATSPTFVVPQGLETVYLSFQTWFEIEGMEPSGFDLMLVAVEDASTGEVIGVHALNSSLSGSTGAPNLPTTSFGHNVAPAFVPVELQVNEVAGKTLRLLFVFSTEDEQFNGFRGWIVDDIRVTTAQTTEAAPAIPLRPGAEVNAMKSGRARRR